MAEGELEHGCSFLEESWLIEHDPKADGGERTDDVAGVAEGEFEHGPRSPFRKSRLIEHGTKANGGERADDVAGVAEGEFEHGPRSPFRKSCLIDTDSKADGGERGDYVSGVAEGELEHRRFLSFVSCACVVPYLMNAVYTSGRAGTSAKLRNSAAYLYQRGTSDAQRTTQYCVARSSEGH